MESTKLQAEINYQFARSGGKGGQNVNKVATKAELRFNIPASTLLTDEEKATLLDKLANKITAEGDLVLTHQTERTQLANKEKVTKKFFRLIDKAFEVQKPRKATRPTKSSVVARKTEKKKRGVIKAGRRRVGVEE